MDLASFRALLSDEGRRLLERTDREYVEHDAVGLATALRKAYPAELVAAALTQSALRRKAAAKFGPDAARLYFTRDGLEQATTAPVAAHRAGRLLGGGSEHRRVVDLCCGNGGDLLALSRAGLAVTGVDADPLTVAIARANLAELGLDGEVELADAESYDRTGHDAVIADPARRSARGREFDVDDFSPPWSFVLDLLTGDACVKTTPAIPHPLIPSGVEAEWVSDRGEVKEAALWSGRLASGVRRRATVLSSDRDSASLTDQDDPGDPGTPPEPAPGCFLYEPDGAVIRAGLVTALIPLLGGGLPHPRIAYVCSEQAVASPFARTYEITDVLRYDVKVLRRTLREREVGRLTVKKRGVDVEPETLRRQLLGAGKRRPSGANAATLVVTRTAASTVALLVQPS